MLDGTDEGDQKRPGIIDLPGLFHAISRELTVAAEQGRILHKTRNIRDSGSPLESRFRNAIGPRLPSPFRVMHGYLFDADSICTPQIDALIIDGSDSHELMTTSDGASYVPYTSAHAVIEVKNSAHAIKEHLSQLGRVLDSIQKMRLRHLEAGRLGHGGPPYESPLSVLLVANSPAISLSDLQDWYSEHHEVPRYTVLLDRGLIIARKQLLLDGAPLSFYDYRNQGEFHIFEPEASGEFPSGRALLWLYFSFIAHLTRFSGEKAIRAFTADIEYRYPMVIAAKLREADAWWNKHAAIWNASRASVSE